LYVPAVFAETDLATLHAFIERHSFALLCSPGADGVPFASHLPLLLDRRAGPHGTLVGHLARSNPQWRHADGQPVLAVFSGPHAYISPAWYGAGEVVPTWNYVAVHASGVFRATHDPAELLRIVQDMVALYEGGREAPWKLEASGDFIERMLRGIVGFRIEIDRIEGKWKLGQNRTAEQRGGAIRGLRAEGGPDAEAVADLMEKRNR
jgi:transcriptional regulator